MENKTSKNTIKFLIIILVGIFIVSAVALFSYYQNPAPKPQLPVSEELKKFSSNEDMVAFIKANSNNYYGGYMMETMAKSGIGVAPTAAGGERATDFSATNIQVAGVDEADIIKNDGKYIYALTNNKISIVDAYPAENMRILSTINVSSARDIFINEDKLVVFSQGYSYAEPFEYKTSGLACLGCGGYSEQQTYVMIYDISDRENPELENNYSIEGNYLQSRMIGNYVYVISNKYINMERPEPPVYILDGIVRTTAATDVYYFGYPDNSYVFTSISAINLRNDDFESKVYLTGYAGTIYVSQDNIFLTNTKTFDYKEYNSRLIQVYLDIVSGETKEKAQKIIDSDKEPYMKLYEIKLLVENYSASLTGDEKQEFDSNLMERLQKFNEEIAKEQEKTVIRKINIEKTNIRYMSEGEVYGHVLNQFSMDEFNGNFRIATTTGEVWSGNSLNHLFVLDEDLKQIGSIEDIAKGEKIYSARFMGNRAYIVTFKKIDPFFVIDLEDPQNPKILGYLKIPGFSDYLHPYDENHVIGIGKEAEDASATESFGRDFAWYQGMKVSLFDVTDVENPKEDAKFLIGDRGTTSPVLSDHKAFLFDKEKNLLVLPIQLYEIDKSKYPGEIPANTYGEFVWQGAYVLNIDLNGISLRGKITHDENEPRPNQDYWYGGNYQTQIQRSLYMDNVLYTFSNAKIKANNLQTVNDINEIVLNKYTENNYYPEVFAV